MDLTVVCSNSSSSIRDACRAQVPVPESEARASLLAQQALPYSACLWMSMANSKLPRDITSRVFCCSAHVSSYNSQLDQLTIPSMRCYRCSLHLVLGLVPKPSARHTWMFLFGSPPSRDLRCSSSTAQCSDALGKPLSNLAVSAADLTVE